MGKRKKVVLIGPVYPYRGGISHYTGLMYRELAKDHDVEMISYKMQYPKILFHKEQKDYQNDRFKIDDTKYLIHTANPFNIIKTARYIRKLKPDQVIIQWWHPYFAPCYILLAKFMGKQNLTFVCHNVFPHERFPLDKMLTRMTLKCGKHFIVHAKEEATELKQIMEEPDYQVTPHPSYNAFRFANLTKEQARGLLNIPENQKVLLFFGFVRPYKGLRYLIEALPEVIKALPDIRLMIVGEFAGEDEKNQYLQQIREAGMTDYVQIEDGYIPDQEVEKYFAACDMVVLPYESATQSGIVQIAYGFEKPVVVTAVGGLPDVVTDQETGYIVPPCNPGKLAEGIIRYYHDHMEERFHENIQKEANRFSWERMTEVIDKWI